MKKFNITKKQIIVILALVTAIMILIGATVIQDSIIKSMMKPIEYSKNSYTDMGSVDSADPTTFSTQNPIEGMIKAAETDYLILYRSYDNKDICIYEKQSGKAWHANGTDGTKPLLRFDYVSLSSSKPSPLTENSLSENCQIETEIINCGFRTNYTFSDLNIKLSVDYTISENVFSVFCPEKSIEEKINLSESQGNEQELFENEAEKINSLMNKIEKLTANESDLLKSFVSTTANNIQSRIISLKDQIKLGGYNEQVFTSIKSDISSLTGFTDNKEVSKEIDKIYACLEEMQRLADIQISSKSMALVSVELLPFLGACVDGTDGYAFYPDMNGAISSFKTPFPHTAGIYSQPVYDSLDPYTSNAVGGSEEEYINAARMPVFGVKCDNSAFLAVIKSGDYDSTITYRPIIEKGGSSQIYATYTLRNMSPLALTSGLTVDSYSPVRCENDIAVDYRFLSNSNADYNGMAREYRNYLVECGLLKNDSSNSSFPILLDFNIGIKNSEGSLFNDYICLTKFKSIKEYLERLKNAGVDKVAVRLSNWTQDAGEAYYCKPIPSKKAGGKKDLDQLMEYCRKNDIPLYLNCNVTSFTQKDVAKSVFSNAAVKNLSNIGIVSNDEEISLYNAGYALSLFKSSYLKKFSDYGFCFENAGNSIWFDFNSKLKQQRYDVGAAMKQILSSDISACAAHRANIYTADVIDTSCDLTVNGSGYYFSTLEIPFYQMVLYSYINLSGEAYNRFSDSYKQRMQNLSVGHTPTWYLTEVSPLEIRNIGEDYCFSSEMEKWFDNIVSEYEIYRQNLGGINAQIYSWEPLGNGVYKTAFSNGDILYTNTAEDSCEVDGIYIEGYSCKRVGGNSNEKTDKP